MQERRKEPRQRVLKAGKVICNDRSCVFDCRITDLTAGGARLKIENPWLVPNRFDFVDTASAKTKRPARVIWREVMEFGISFTDAA